VAGKLKSEGILDPDKIVLTAVVSAPAMPADVGPQVAEVLKLKGDVTRGATAVQRCYMCHNINGQGIDFGPGLTGWGATQPTDVIAEAMINPNKDIAHGYEGHTLMTNDGLQIDGMLLSDGNFAMIKSVGGQTQIVPKEKLKSKQKMTRSLMMNAAMLGMTAQDIADVIAYLKQPVK
jgi:putative heme-binding domain-containing protein